MIDISLIFQLIVELTEERLELYLTFFEAPEIHRFFYCLSCVTSF